MSHDSSTHNIAVIELPPPQNVWTKEEHTQMLLFMDQNRTLLEENIRRNIERCGRSNKAQFFVRMASVIGTKTDKQCKSRYQKKERVLLTELDFEPQLVDTYMRSKREKRIARAAKSPNSTYACDSTEKTDESLSGPIITFEQLVAVVNASQTASSYPPFKTSCKIFLLSAPAVGKCPRTALVLGASISPRWVSLLTFFPTTTSSLWRNVIK